MSLTRKFLKDLGIEGDEVDKIINEHRSTVDSLRDDIDSLKAEAEKTKAVEKELNDLKESVKASDSYKEKYEKSKRNSMTIRLKSRTKSHQIRSQKHTGTFSNPQALARRELRAY